MLLARAMAFDALRIDHRLGAAILADSGGRRSVLPGGGFGGLNGGGTECKRYRQQHRDLAVHDYLQR
jgi:hypothetical protein